jgi:hypothetical protein
MKRLNILLWCFLSFMLTGALYAQNITGIWRGTFYNPTEIAMGGSKYRYEVQINNKGREAKGVTYSYQTTRFYGKASLVGVWSSSSKNLVLQEDDMLDLKITGGGDGCLMTCYLTYKKEDGKEYLEGTYTSYNMNNKNQNCGGGRVFLEKVPDSDFELEDFLLDKPTEKSTSKVKPGQEDFLVKKPEGTTPKPPTGGAKPPVTTTKPPATIPKTSSSAAKPPATKPPVTSSKTPTPGAKPPVSPTKPATTATKPPATKPPATAPKTATSGTKPPVTNTKPPASTAKISAPATKPTEKPANPTKSPVEPNKVSTEIVKKDTEPVKPNPAPVPPPPPILKERKNELFKTITTNKRIIEVSFYDNGEIDGDTISVYNNNRLIASKKGLSAKPVVIKVELTDDNPEQDVVMVAENLGRIPPNTALMIVMAGDERFTVFLNSSEQKNAMVRFKYQP